MAIPSGNQGPISPKCCPGNPMWLKQSLYFPCFTLCLCITVCFMCKFTQRPWLIYILCPLSFFSFHLPTVSLLLLSPRPFSSSSFLCLPYLSRIRSPVDHFQQPGVHQNWWRWREGTPLPGPDLRPVLQWPAGAQTSSRGRPQCPDPGQPAAGGWRALSAHYWHYLHHPAGWYVHHNHGDNHHYGHNHHPQTALTHHEGQCHTGEQSWVGYMTHTVRIKEGFESMRWVFWCSAFWWNIASSFLIGFLKFLHNLKVLKTIFERLNSMAK